MRPIYTNEKVLYTFEIIQKYILKLTLESPYIYEGEKFSVYVINLYRKRTYLEKNILLFKYQNLLQCSKKFSRSSCFLPVFVNDVGHVSAVESVNKIVFLISIFTVFEKGFWNV